MTKEELAIELLHEGLNLCVRAKKIDQGLEEKYFKEEFPDSAKMRKEELKCLTPHLWVQDQYDKDLTAWEDKTRKFLEQ